MSIDEGSRIATTAEQRLEELGIQLPAPPQPFGAYVESVQVGNLLFLSGMLPTAGREARFIGRVGAELDAQAGATLRLSRRETRLPLRASISARSTGEADRPPRCLDRHRRRCAGPSQGG